jgi:hypothetical protein
MAMEGPAARKLAFRCAVGFGPLALWGCTLISLSAFDDAVEPRGSTLTSDSSVDSGDMSDDAQGSVGNPADGEAQSDSLAAAQDNAGAPEADATSGVGAQKDAAGTVTDAADDGALDASRLMKDSGGWFDRQLGRGVGGCRADRATANGLGRKCFRAT